MADYIINTDGGARGNPGPAGIGFVIAKGGTVVAKGGAHIGDATNNYAEYEALIRGLEALKKIAPKSERARAEVEARLDSELVVKQLNGVYQIKDQPLQLQFVRVWNLRVAEFPNIRFVHVRREENADADRLVNEALDAAERVR